MKNKHSSLDSRSLSKVPNVVFGFWVIKVAATTLGETGGDWVSMSLKLGYLVGSAIFALIFIALVWGQVKAEHFRPVLYWATIVATTTLGTTLADFADRSVGLGYPGGVAIVTTLLAASLAVWYWSEGTVSVQSITRPKVEWFYWVTILFSQTLGTALGDWMTGSDRGGLGLGYEVGALVFGAGLIGVAALYFWTGVSHTLLFWLAFVLTRPLGATLGDLLDKPVSAGGLHLSRLYASLVLLAFIAACIYFIPQRAAPADEATRSSTMLVHGFWETPLNKTASVLAASLALSLPASGWTQSVPDEGRAVSGTVIPSSGTTAGSRAVAPDSSAPPAPVAGSLSGPSSTGQCAALRKRYAQSQSCYQHYRLKNGGLRPGAAKHCKQIENPSVKCGSEVVG